MVKDGKKAAIGLAAAVAGIFVFAKAKAKPPPEGDAASITIRVLDSHGNLVEHHSPMNLVEGGSYTLEITVENQSTKLGNPYEAVLSVSVSASTYETILVPPTEEEELFAADESKTYQYPFTVPMGTAYQTGSIVARVFDPSDNELAQATDSIDIIASSGTISPGYIYYEALGAWQVLYDGMEVPYDTLVAIAPSWINTSAVPMIGHVALFVEYPDGSVVQPTAVNNQDMEAEPGNGYLVEFQDFATTQEGIYKLTAELYYGSTLIASVSINIAVSADIVYKASVVINV